MMTKKHFQKVAEIIQAYDTDLVSKDLLIRAFVKFFEDDNPRFDIQRFLMACEPTKKIIK